jgi:hypothetical protein
MTRTDDLIEQQLLLHESHLKRIDELFDKAHEGEAGEEPSDPLLAALKDERDILAGLLHRMRGDAPESWDEIEERHFGPLAVWEALARVLEQAIERREKS